MPHKKKKRTYWGCWIELYNGHEKWADTFLYKTVHKTTYSIALATSRREIMPIVRMHKDLSNVNKATPIKVEIEDAT